MLVKFLHVLGAVLLLGNVITTGLWSHWAMRRPEPDVAAFAAGAILAADLWLTLGGGALLTISGLWMAMQLGLGWQVPWLRHGALALGASTLVWLLVLLPLQLRLRTLARAADRPALARTFAWWSALGWADTALLAYGLWVMVTKAG